MMVMGGYVGRAEGLRERGIIDLFWRHVVRIHGKNANGILPNLLANNLVVQLAVKSEKFILAKTVAYI
jgi:hypothetical protein